MVSEFKRSNGRYIFKLCVRGVTPESLGTIKGNLCETFTLLREALITKNFKECSIAKSHYIKNSPWSNIVELIKVIFENNFIKIIICKGTLQCVTEDRREKTFMKLHYSPIGGHMGVSKTFNRIRQNFYWENLKQDIQRQIQQCIQCQIEKLVR